jgi:hypothetical protein
MPKFQSAWVTRSSETIENGWAGYFKPAALQLLSHGYSSGGVDLLMMTTQAQDRTCD